MLKNLSAFLFIFLLGLILFSIEKPREKKEFKEVFRENKISMYKEGVFTGTGKGFVSDILVEVEIENVEKDPFFYIKNISVVESKDIERYFNPAREKVIRAVLEKQTTDVDVVTEATRSRDGLIEAIKDAVDKAKKNN